MSTPDGLDYYGEFSKIAPTLALLSDVRMALNLPDDQVTLVLPPDVLPGVTWCYGLAVARADVPTPLLGLAAASPTPERPAKCPVCGHAEPHTYRRGECPICGCDAR